MNVRPIDFDFLAMLCECGRTRREHMADTLAEDHAFEPVDQWARRHVSASTPVPAKRRRR